MAQLSECRTSTLIQDWVPIKTTHTHPKGNFIEFYIICSSTFMIFLAHRSSDSTKYGTNKSSGASVTSGNHHSAKHQLSSGTHEPVSKCRKPPLHPNYHHTNQNHRNATTTITNTPFSVYNNPVHPKNRLLNNTIFHNNQYTFSLNRYDDSGYLESRPLSSASFYGDGQRVSRGTKSDIGVPCHRPATSALKPTSAHANHAHANADGNKPKLLPSVKSEFLLSYLNNNHKQSSSGAIHRNDHHNNRTTNDNNLNELNDSTNASSSAYRISGVATNDYLDTYKTGPKHFYAKSTSRLDRNSTTDIHTATHNSQQTINELQRNRIINFVNRNDATANGGGGGGIASKNVGAGPLLYLDSKHDSSKNKRNFTDAQYQSMQNVSKL